VIALVFTQTNKLDNPAFFQILGQKNPLLGKRATTGLHIFYHVSLLLATFFGGQKND